MTLEKFKTIVNYLNEINKGSFTDVELENSAKNYLLEYEESKKNGLSTNVMKSLCEELYTDMDYMDYMDFPPFMRGVETFVQLEDVLKTFVEYITE